MNWHSVQESETKRLNVFHCESYPFTPLTKRLIFQVKTHRRWGKHPSTPKKKGCHIIVTPVTSTVSNFGDHVPPVA
jgi:hypothetical protein